MKPLFFLAIGFLCAAASCADTQKGAAIMGSTSGTTGTQDDGPVLALRPLRIADASTIDGLKLVLGDGQPILVYSTQVQTPPYALVVHAAPIADIARVSEVARIARTLPVAPLWDARLVGSRYEILYELAGGAVNAILLQDAAGASTGVSDAHPMESFTHPHFVRAGVQGQTTDVAAVADLKRLVVFPGGAKQPVKYAALADGADGVVGGTAGYWTVAKSAMSGESLFDTLPGRITMSGIGGSGRRSVTVPDLLAYELDAAPLGNDVVIFATSRPALVILGQRPERQYRLTAENRSWLLQLSRPTILVTSQFVHLAAIVSPGSDRAAILYGAIPIGVFGK
jgi:hypothetical protein